MDKTLSKHGSQSFSPGRYYIVNKGSRGLGRNAFARTTYKIQKSDGPKHTVEIVSPIAKAVDRAKALISLKRIRETNKCSNISKKKTNHRSRVSNVIKKKSTKVKKEKKGKKKTGKK